MSATLALTGRYLAEYSRRRMNLALLVLVPLIFVMLAASAIADFAEVVGSVADPPQLAAPTAGWAAAFLAGVAGFFHVLGSKEVDRRLTLAGMGVSKVLAARLASGSLLALVAASASLLALTVRTGVANPVRAVVGTAMFALIYLGIGIAVGTVVRNEVNGSLVVIFVWMLDVFLGPAMAGGDVWVTRLFPSHFVTLVMLDAASGHSGPIGDLGWALAWTLGSLGFAAAVFVVSAAVPPARAERKRRPFRRIAAGVQYGFRDYRRNMAMWVLLVALPVFFITLSFYVTPNDPTPVELVEDGAPITQVLSMIDVHGAIMVPITIGFLAGLAGLFVVQGSLEADSRLAISGFSPGVILASRLAVIAFAAILTTSVALGVTALDFAPLDWTWFAIGNLIVAITYGMLGVIVGVLLGRLGGLYVMFLVPFVDVGIAQNVMFSAVPPAWGAVMPAHGAVRLLIDGAFTSGFDQADAALLAALWLVGLTAVAIVVFHRVARPKSG